MTELTQARLKEVLSYDPETGVFTWGVDRPDPGCRGWRVAAGTVAGLTRPGRYSKIGVDGGRYASHRLAWLWLHGSFPARGVDHRTGDGLDNSEGNLRECSQLENAQNAKLHCRNSTGHRGVTFHKARGKYRAYITLQGVTQHLGYFTDVLAAAGAYLTAKSQLHTFQPVPRPQ